LISGGDRVVALNRTLDGRPDPYQVACDLRDPERIAVACAEALHRLGGLDACIVNAAVRRIAGLDDLSPAAWLESIQVNLTASFLIAKALAPALRATSGSLVFIGSHAGRHSFEGGAAYCASKAGLTSLADVLRLELRPSGVRVSLVTAGAIRNRPEDTSTEKIAPEDVAEVVQGLLAAGPSLNVAEIEICPRAPAASPLFGLERLQIL
jgi:NAD(P)-dependent dehydrogenase (short-subunit alcohol dehydrogenase family)